VSIDPASEHQRQKFPEKHHDFDSMGAALSRMTTGERQPACPQATSSLQISADRFSEDQAVEDFSRRELRPDSIHYSKLWNGLGFRPLVL
jgi:hypothetical protein